MQLEKVLLSALVGFFRMDQKFIAGWSVRIITDSSQPEYGVMRRAVRRTISRTVVPRLVAGGRQSVSITVRNILYGVMKDTVLSYSYVRTSGNTSTVRTRATPPE